MSTTLALLGGSPVHSAPWPAWPVFGKEEEVALLRTLRSGKWGKLDGSEVATFEKRFAEYVGAKHAIAVCNGTVSLRIALMAGGIEAGDEVIVPPYTFLATATAVIEANATPIFVDIDRETFNLDPKQIEAAITSRTRAIIPVHLGGMACDMGAINAIAKKHNLMVIEDAAHAHGSEYNGQRIGSCREQKGKHLSHESSRIDTNHKRPGDDHTSSASIRDDSCPLVDKHLASFSFQSSKNLTSGEGGLIVTNDDALADACRSIHNCGRLKGGAWYEHHVISANYRLGEFAGAILNCQLDRLDEQTDRRDANGRYLDAKLAAIPGITPQRRDAFVTRNAQHLYLFRYDAKVFGMPREKFLQAMEAEGIPVAGGYLLPLYRQPLFANHAFGPYTACIDSHPDLDYGKLHLPNVEAICASEGAWLYQSVLLGSQRDMDDVVRAVEKVYEHRAALMVQEQRLRRPFSIQQTMRATLMSRRAKGEWIRQ